MASKFFLFIFLVVIGFGSIQNEKSKKYMGHSLWPQQTRMLQLKELKATFKKGAQSMEEETDGMLSEEMPETQIQKQANSGEVEMNLNRIKREMGAGNMPLSGSMESSKREDEQVSKLLIKRQTALIGNANRLQNLVNLPVQLKVLANVLSHLNTGILDAKQPSAAATANSIVGNGNTVSSLINAPVNVDTVLNVLSSVNKAPGASGSGTAGPVEGILAGLLGGAGKSGGLLNGVLGGGDAAGPLSGLLGNNLGDLLGGLLGGEGLVGQLLNGQDGKEFVGDLLNNLLAGVLQLVDNLLQLLVGLLDALLQGLGDKEGAAAGNNTAEHSLVKAPKRLKEFINVLTTLKQQLLQALDAAAISAASASDTGLLGGLLLSTPTEAAAPTAASSTQTTTSLPQELLGSVLKTVDVAKPAAGSTGILGNNNAVSNLLNVAPDANLNLNLLSQVTDVLKGASSKGDSPSGSKPNEICFDAPITPDNTRTRNNNTVTSAINVKPKIHLDLNLLSSVTQSGQANGPTQRVCITMPQKDTSAPRTTTIKPDVTLPPIITTVTPTPAPTAATLARPQEEVCFYVWVDPAGGTVVKGNNNQVNSLLNLPVNLDLDLNVLSKVQQTASNMPRNLVMKRVCLPGNRPVAPLSISPASERPRCFRRTCAKWKHLVDYKCADSPNEYPKYTETKEALN